MAEAPETSVGEISLTIHLPACAEAGIDFIESVHSRLDSIGDVKETLAATSQLNQLTNYDLVYEGAKITELYDDLTPLDEFLPQDATKASLRMVERPYNLKAVYEHLIRFRENIGLNFLDFANKSFGVGVGGSRLSSLGLKNLEAEEEEASVENESKAETPSSEEETAQQEELISEEDAAVVKDKFAAFFKESSASSSGALSILSKWALPIRSLTLSQWNPVPPPQKLKGDLLYLTLTTLENEAFAITCHASGFFVSRISGTNFNPVLKINEKGVSHKNFILFKLVASLSSKFSETLTNNKAALIEASQFPESYLIPSQVVTNFPWAVSEAQLQEQTVPDYSRSQLSALTNGTDGADLVKDWNEEFQGLKEFPRESFSERLMRDKLLNKYIQEFNQTATSTALEIIKGNLSPLNPNEELKKHIYLRNNIFYSFGVNATGSHDFTGGDEAARYCFGKDLNSIKLMNRVDAGGACSLLTCVVDYLGQRVVCQAPVPGIFSEQVDKSGEPIDKVSYGYFLEKDEIKVDKSMEEAIKPIAEAFHLKPHTLKLETGASTPEGTKLIVSKDTKGIKGSDGRDYVIDMYRTAPLDIAFLDAHYDETSESSYPHKEASIRHEAVEEWYKRKAAALFKLKTEELEKEGALEKEDGEEKPQIAIPFDEIVFNPDSFCGVDDSEEDKEVVREIGALVTEHLISERLEDISRNIVPVDGTQLTEYLHRHGVNMRYLGTIAKRALQTAQEFKDKLDKDVAENEKKTADFIEQQKKKQAEKEAEKQSALEETAETKQDGETNDKEDKVEEKTNAELYPVAANMNVLYTLAVQEMIVRSVKHVLRKEGEGVPLLLKPHFVSHFHNCLLGADVNAAPEVSVSSDLKPLFTNKETQFTQLTTQKVKELVEHEVKIRFRYELSESWLEDLRKPQILREIALKFGIQWKSQEYFFEKEAFEEAHASVTKPQEEPSIKGKKKKVQAQTPAIVVRTTTFVPEDIVSFVPVVKDSSYRCALVDEVFESARQQLQQEDKEIGLSLCTELVGFYQQIYGSVHLETAEVYSALAQLYGDCGMFSEACILSRKAIILYERLRGIDSYETANAYIKTSLFEVLRKNSYNGFLLNAEAFNIWSRIYGKDHPNVLNIFSNCAVMLDAFKFGDESQAIQEKALETSIRLNGELSDITCIFRFRCAVGLYQKAKYAEALDHFTIAASNFAKVLGPEDKLTKESVTFASSIRRFLEYTQQEQQKALAAKKAAAAAQAPKKAAAPKPKGAKRGKKSKSAAIVNSDIGSKSVEEILQFVEGASSKKDKKKQ
ncbi:hypothetical protein PUMCH_003147 [Australozyma saopauloensis]|uniref:Clu domain-containing protein n=1 Tax=Australozyma saopauloensis TaxID=291208 RepID=A0AAX4HBQ9_9ASCO|nr:hypothetical protein PUMCH_003147 [[Candida] saopauloensis]